MDTTRQERRKAKRVSYISEVWCEGQDVGHFNTRTSDLSATGVFLDLMNPTPQGSIVTMKFWVQSVQIEAEGEVIHSKSPIGMGVRFLNLKPEYRAAIEKMVAERSE